LHLLWQVAHRVGLAAGAGVFVKVLRIQWNCSIKVAQTLDNWRYAGLHRLGYQGHLRAKLDAKL
jgi:hypothetical protein